MSPLQNNTLITRSSTNLLKVIFELLVLFHHLYVPLTNFGLRTSHILGPVAVGGFLVLSGFGVGINFLNKGKEYSSKLLKNRVPTIYLMLFITNLCYLFLHYYIGNDFENAFDLIISVLYLPVFNGFVALSHYIYFLADLIIYYFLFLLFSKILSKNKNTLLLTAICILIVNCLIIAVLTYVNLTTNSTRYLRACLCFPVGLLLANFNVQLCKAIKKLKWLFAFALFAIGVLLYVFIDCISLHEYILPIILASSIIIAFYGFDFKSKIIDYFAKLILYIYASHEFFREFFIYKFPQVDPNVRLVLVVLLSLAVAVIVHAIVNVIGKRKRLTKQTN